MFYTVNRFSGGFALLEDADRVVVRVDQSLLPVETREGDVVCYGDDGYYIDRVATDARRKRISGILDSLWE